MDTYKDSKRYIFSVFKRKLGDGSLKQWGNKLSIKCYLLKRKIDIAYINNIENDNLFSEMYNEEFFLDTKLNLLNVHIDSYDINTRVKSDVTVEELKNIPYIKKNNSLDILVGNIEENSNVYIREEYIINNKELTPVIEDCVSIYSDGFVMDKYRGNSKHLDSGIIGVLLVCELSENNFLPFVYYEYSKEMYFQTRNMFIEWNMDGLIAME